jgi:cytochrome b6-f complex iron-sulfur subunit
METPSLKQDPSLPEEKSPELTRRDFLGLVIRFGLLATLAGMIFPALSYLAPVTKRGPVGGLADAGSVDDVALGAAKKVIVAGSAVILIHTAQGFKALSAVCTHLGCLVDWDQARGQVICPCHGGVYDADGKVVSGPPPKALPAHEVNVINGRIMVKV